MLIISEQKSALASVWTAGNPTLRLGVMGWEYDTGKVKAGDGVTAWNALAYLTGLTGPPGADGATGAAGPANVLCHSVASDVNNATDTLANITGLSFAIGASEKWCYKFSLDIDGDTVSSGLSVAATAPAGVVSVRLSMLSSDDANIGQPITLFQVSGSGVAASFVPGLWGGVTGRVWVDLSVTNGATAGNVQLQFAQQTATGTNTTVKAGSNGIGTKSS